MSRRGENIRKRKDGRWEGRYTAYDAEIGKKHVRSVYAETYASAKEKLAMARRSEGRGKTRANRELETKTFCQMAEEWLEDVRNYRKYSTYRKYRTVYEKYLKQELGSCFMNQLDGETARKALEIKEKELSVSLQNSMSCVLKQILAYACVHYHMEPITYSPYRRPAEKKPLEILSATEQARLLQYLYDGMDIYKLGIIICISTGLRLGEICALKWEDIDIHGKLLHVNATVQRIKMEEGAGRTALMESTPKSLFSQREIPLSDEIMKQLLPYYGKGKYVIKANCPMEPRTYQNKFYKYLLEAGVGRKNFHILRHTFATNCVVSGTDIKSLSEILGHSDVRITLNRYVHPSIETKRKHLNSLSAIYGQYVGSDCP